MTSPPFFYVLQKLGPQPLADESYLCFRHFLMPRKTSHSGRQQVSRMTSLHETKSSSFPPFKQLEYFLRKLLHYQQNNSVDCPECHPVPTSNGRWEALSGGNLTECHRPKQAAWMNNNTVKQRPVLQDCGSLLGSAQPVNPSFHRRFYWTQTIWA